MSRGRARTGGKGASPGKRATPGFTLLELIVVVAILSILAGAALPVAWRAADRAARASTRAELVRLAEATLEHARDTARAPATLADLVRPPEPPVAGWSGPYLARSMPDPRTGAPGWQVDGWSRPYAIEPFEHGVRLCSLGRDGEPDLPGATGAGDDLVCVVDVRPVLRERTLATVATVNRALDAYHDAARAQSEPLPADVPRALERLVRAGLLPDAERFRRDAWGLDLVADPPGREPLVRVRSSALGGERPVPARTLPAGESWLSRDTGGLSAISGSTATTRGPTSRSSTTRPTTLAPGAMPAASGSVRRSEAWRRLEQRALGKP